MWGQGSTDRLQLGSQNRFQVQHNSLAYGNQYIADVCDKGWRQNVFVTSQGNWWHGPRLSSTLLNYSSVTDINAELWKSFEENIPKKTSSSRRKKIFVSVSEPLWRQIFDRRLVIKPKIKKTNSIRVTQDKNSPGRTQVQHQSLLKFTEFLPSPKTSCTAVHFYWNDHPDSTVYCKRTHRMLFPMLRKNRHFRLVESLDLIWEKSRV